MQKITLILSLFVCTFTHRLYAQQGVDSLQTQTERKSTKIKKFIVPGSLIILGSSLSGSHLENEIKTGFHDGSENAIDFQFPIDDLIQYTPIVTLYTADLLGAKAKNHWFDQTKYLVIANIITAGITHVGKNLIHKNRPNGSSRAFPSGHTSFSFTNAAVLYEEFKDSSPVLAWSGYGTTTLVGSLRVINNRHWISDVMVGAGIGILVTKLVYHFEPLKNWNPFKKSNDITLMPTLNNDQVGMYFKLEF